MKIEETGTSFLDEPQNGLVKHEPTETQVVSLDNIAALDSMEAAPFNLSSEYYTPKTPGETIRVIFDRIANNRVPSAISDELIDLTCCFFFVREDDVVKQICNGSKRLVGTFQSIDAQRGQAFEITYEGKQRNKSNGFSSDAWSVKPLFNKRK